MTAKDLIRSNLELSNQLVTAYLDDLTDADIAVKAVEGMNPIAWQLGHLISGEAGMVDQVAPGRSPALPEGFAESFDRQGAADGATYPTKEAFLNLWKAQREATLKVIEEMPDAKLDDETGVSYAPTVGSLLSMLSSHPLMHVGQWVAVRRKLNKKIVI